MASHQSTEPPSGQGRASLAEFERRVRELVKLQKEAQELAERVKGNPNASESDVARLRTLQSKIPEAVSDLATYMEQPQFSAEQRVEMQKMWEKAMAEGTPSKPASDGGKR